MPRQGEDSTPTVVVDAVCRLDWKVFPIRAAEPAVSVTIGETDQVVILAGSVDQLERLSSLFAMAAISLRTAQAEQTTGGAS